ncbi:MAG TPA: helix-turn-helix domain-containing protein [Mycobacterium sp.]|nr:helix-turn-helix domain-containing protein [Mycobacterium sp.]
MRAPRRDVLRNRQRVVAAARAAFAEDGPDVSLEEIARRAGVGATTLYRHFADRDDLVEAVLEDLFAAVRDNSDLAAAISDPLEAFRWVFTSSCDLSDGETEAFLRLATTSPRTRAHAQRLITDLVAPVTARLREAGALHSGVTAEDIAMLIRMTSAADDHQSRAMAIQVLLAGLTQPAKTDNRTHQHLTPASSSARPTANPAKRT